MVIIEGEGGGEGVVKDGGGDPFLNFFGVGVDCLVRKKSFFFVSKR